MDLNIISKELNLIYDELDNIFNSDLKNKLYKIKNLSNLNNYWQNIGLNITQILNDETFNYQPFELEINIENLPDYLNLWNYTSVLSLRNTFRKRIVEYFNDRLEI